MKKSFKLLFSLFLFTLIFSLNSFVFAQTTVNLITTNDMHGVLESSDTSVGIAQVSAIKNSTENALLIDSGDATQGTTLATINKGNDIIKLMNAAGYDCMVAGNHEFDFGSDQLLMNAETADFPILSANALTSTGTLLPATTTITKAGKTIGFVGITTSITNTATNPALRPGVTFGNEITAAKEAIASLNGKVDTIVLLTHLGDDATAVPVTSQNLLDGLSDSELAQVSAVLDGHSHTIESEPYTRNNLSIPVIQDQTQLSHVGKVALTFNDDGSVSATEQVMDYTTANAYDLTSAGEQAKTDTQTAFDSVKEAQQEITSQVIGETQTPLWGGYIYWDYAEPRIVETSFGDFASDAFKDAAQTYATSHNINGEVIGIINGGGIGNSINPGKITYGDILNSFNHGNMMVVLQTTPAELYTVLEAGLRTTGQAKDGMLERESVSGSFIQASGITYSYNPAGQTGSKVTSIVTDKGTTLSRDDSTTPIIVGTQNYVQQSFPDSEELVMLGGEDTVISDFITNNSETLNYPTSANRIQITNDISPSTYQVTVPVYDKSETEPTDGLANITVHLSIDNAPSTAVLTNSEGNLVITLTKGAHTLELDEASVPVYVNNYSGSGTNFTRSGYYSLSFAVQNPSDIPATDITLSTDSVDLSPQYGSNTQTVTATLVPANSTDSITWSVADNQIASIVPNGSSVTITGIEEGRTEVTATCGNISKEVTVIVSNDPIIATSYYIMTANPDYFTVYAEDVHANRDISNGVEVKQVSFFTWSDPLQNDMDCKVVNEIGDSGNYLYTFPVNENNVNNYYYDASNITIHIYASGEAGTNGNMIGVLYYNYSSENTMSSNLGVTPYVANEGFITPTFGNNEVAGSALGNPLEGIRVSTPLPGLIILYSVHVSGIGWTPSVYNGSYTGTMHLGRSIEAVKMELTGTEADNYSLTYKTVAIDNSSSNWCSNGEVAGTTGRSLPLKSIQINLEKIN